MSRGQIFIISGPSGVGKGTIIRKVLSKIPGTKLSISATTRQPRTIEVPKRDYYFMSDETFDNHIKQGHFLEWCTIFSDRYGTLYNEVENYISEGFNVILEIDVQGAEKVRSKIHNVNSIFIAPPSFEELRRRLLVRNTEDPDIIALRLKIAKEEMDRRHEFDHVLINDAADKAVDDIIDIIQSKMKIKEIKKE